MLLRDSSGCQRKLSPSELMERFNLAFFEGQNGSKLGHLSDPNDHHQLSTGVDEYPEEAEPEVDDCFIDYLISPLEAPPPNGNSNNTSNYYFDFNDFVQTFDQNICSSAPRTSLSSVETCTSVSTDATSGFFDNPCQNPCCWDYSKYFCSNQNASLANNGDFQDLELSDIDLSDALSNESIDLDSLATDLQNLDEGFVDQCAVLPPVSTIGGCSHLDFSSFLRNASEDDLSYVPQDSPKGNFGHLIGTTLTTTLSDTIPYPDNLNSVSENNSSHCQLPENQTVVTQQEALMYDDPLLSSGNLTSSSTSTSNYHPQRQHLSSESSSESSQDFGHEECENDSEENGFSCANLQCQWEDCYQTYDSQSTLVRHIEKCHVEIKRGDEFTCFWANCPRQVKPFNARYKLLIHMRVHSGEKPNKCPFEGCNKAFSRLENLKIHQRSHTGERPYLCQFPTCTKSFSNSSDRAKHQRTHFDNKPYACQVMGCTKKYTDPSSLRKHVKNHTAEEQMMLKKKSAGDDQGLLSTAYTKKFLDPNRQKAVKCDHSSRSAAAVCYANFEHNYSNALMERRYDSSHIRQDLKNKISEKNKLKKLIVPQH